MSASPSRVVGFGPPTAAHSCVSGSTPASRCTPFARRYALHTARTARVWHCLHPRSPCTPPQLAHFAPSPRSHHSRVRVRLAAYAPYALSSEETHAALDELVAEQMVSVEQGYYRFEQTALRAALLSQMDDARRRELHRQAGRSLLSSGNTPEIRVEAAWHLLHAGDETEGADLLAEAGRDYFRKQIGQETLKQIVHALEAAVDVYERQGRSEYEIAGLMFMVVPAAFFIDLKVTLKYGERAVRLGLKITGLALAQKLSRYLGKKLGLIAALIVAGVRFAGQRRRGSKYGLREAIAELCTIVPSTVGTFNICYDITTVKRLIQLLEPLRLFGEGHIATLMHDYALGHLGVPAPSESATQLAPVRPHAQTEDDEPETQFVASEAPESTEAPFRFFVLSARDGGRPVVVGGVALQASASNALRIDMGVLGSLAQVLYERQGSTVDGS